ncbi:dehydrogenase [Bacterioplanes sanyensis]|uniref:Dehydrogenase n=1 Tax=Bacterioplanes sanyensis TaxID=1249553 RepID=A0A222FDV2_9GAMM|nr:PQQ-dependent sugar dehydrogenase [Bacterioplanes sanyensis]ASP37188.1 dehydrogenase [Bacterioplanes sanyensis]
MRWIAIAVCYLSLGYLSLSSPNSAANTAPVPVADGFSIIWSLLPLDQQRLLVAERRGTLSLVNLASVQRQTIAGLPDIHAAGQGGLLDMAILNDDPKPWLYFTYSHPHQDGAITALARARLDTQQLQLQSLETLLLSQSHGDGNRHYGSRIALTDKYLFISIGDRGDRDTGQRLDTHAGKILRLHHDGRVPADNPFVDDPTALNEIWSYGHRNPQGMVYDARHEQLWAIEHGPRGGDELNLIRKGGNYGWALVSQGKEYWNPAYVGDYRQHPDMLDPLHSFTPSIAPGSLLLWQSDSRTTTLLAGALKLRHLNQLTIHHADGGSIKEHRWLEDMDQRIRALAKHPSGDLLFSIDDGVIYRWSPRSVE